MNDLRNRRVLITGGAGFIGSELARQAAALGGEVILVDNLVNGKRENVADLLSDRLTLEVTDIRNDKEMRRLLAEVDVVFHLACLGVRHSVHAPQENHEVNATASLVLLRLARESEVKRFVYVSSSEVYGTAQWVPMSEHHPTFPHTVYGASKLAGECYTRAFWDTYGFPTVVVRPFNAYGPRSHHEGDSGEVIPKFLLRAMARRELIVFGDGEQTRDFTFVEDTARGVLLAGWIDQALGETINLGWGREISINELAGLVREVGGEPGLRVERIEPRPGDVRRLYADALRARELLGFEPTIALRRGLERLKGWYETQGVAPERLLADERVCNWQGESEA